MEDLNLKEKTEFSNLIKLEALLLLLKITKLTQEEIVKAFDNILSYNSYKKKKRSGGFRTISAPHESVKLIQRKILKNFLYKIIKRTNFYKDKIGLKNSVYYQNVFNDSINPQIYGMIPGCSVVDATKIHCDGNYNFIIKLDLKNAFGSVSKDMIKNTLYKVILNDCEAIFYTSKKRFISKNLNRIIQLAKIDLGKPPKHNYWDSVCLNSEKYKKFEEDYSLWREKAKNWLSVNAYDKIISLSSLENLIKEFDCNKFISFSKTPKYSFPRYSFFPQHQFKNFRKHILEESCKSKNITDTDIPLIIKCLCEYMSTLFCFNGCLPQGAPSSGFLLNLIISEKKLLNSIQELEFVKKVSVYVDDIIIATEKKPTLDLVDKIVSKISQTNIFKNNSRKNQVYDLRQKSAPVLGMKLVKKVATKDEILSVEDEFKPQCSPCLTKALKNNRPWYILKVSLSKKKQKEYRALFHLVNTTQNNINLLNKAIGYHGHIVSVYGLNLNCLPSALREPVRIFRLNFIKNPV